MVRIRLKRMGRTHRPFYRINAVEKREKRDGKVLENLGWYNPVDPREDQQVHLKEERIRHWLSVGAQPSNTVGDLLAKHGLLDAEAREAARLKRVGKKMKALDEKRKAEEEAARVAAEEEARKAAEEAAAKAAEEKAKAEAEAAAAAEGEGGGDAEEGESKAE